MGATLGYDESARAGGAQAARERAPHQRDEAQRAVEGAVVLRTLLWQRYLILNKAGGFTLLNICCTFPTPFLYVSL